MLDFISIACELLKKYPQFKDSIVEEVSHQGHDNRSFIIDGKFIIKIPSSDRYKTQIEKDFKYLNLIREKVDIKIPTLHIYGIQEDIHPYSYGIYHYINGDNLHFYDNVDKSKIAEKCAMFLKQLHMVDCSNGPEAGKHNFYRGGNLNIYYDETVQCLETVKGVFNCERLLKYFNDALSVEVDQKVFVHGDFVVTNLLYDNNDLSAVIDFGILGVGDCSCDLSMYWTYFDDESRVLFKELLNLDENIWIKAKGWVIWKMLLLYINDNDLNAKEVLNNIIKE